MTENWRKRPCGHPHHPYRYVMCVTCGERVEDDVTARRAKRQSRDDARHIGCRMTSSPAGGLLTGVTCHGGPVMEWVGPPIL